MAYRPFGQLAQSVGYGRHQPKCEICLRARCTSKHLDTKPKAPKPIAVTHIAGYVPPKGSIAQQFFGHVVPPL